MKIVFTCQEQSYKTAEREIAQALCARGARGIGPGVGALETDFPPGQVHDIMLGRPVLFTRHLFPVTLKLAPGADPLDHADEIAASLDPQLSYSVQARSAGGPATTRALSEALRGRGHTPDIRRPAQAVSLYYADDALYIGVSPTQWNLSDWNGGMMHFSAKDLISRAECKLLEAFTVFGVALRPRMRALDLGASPGGWTRALAARGLEVTAVDPAALDARVAALPNVRHARQTAQAFMRGDGDTYDLIASDMKIDAQRSLSILFDLLPKLKPEGSILSTLKLPKQDTAKIAAACVSAIRERAVLLGARQLFHNRSEITVRFVPY